MSGTIEPAPRVTTYDFRDVPACAMCGEAAYNARTMGLRLNHSQGMFPRKKTGVAVSVCRCRTCGLIYSNPQPKPKLLEDHYGIPPEDYWGEERLNYPSGYFERQINRARKLVPFYEGMRALDIGIGLGHAVLSMQAAGLDVYGIEPSRPFLERAIELKKLDKTKFLLVSVEEAELPASYFDFVTFGAVFEHLFEPAQALEKALNWTKPGGIIHLEVPNSDYLVSKIVNSYFNLMFTNYVTNLSPMHSPFHLFEFTLESFKKHAEQLNYSVADHWTDVCTIRRIPKFLHPFLRWTMERTGTGMQLTVFLRKNSST